MNQCNLCHVPLGGSRKAFLFHCSGKKHNRLLPKYITAKGEFTNEQVKNIVSYFEKFGTITKHIPTITENSVSIDFYFQNQQTLTNVIQRRLHLVCGKKLEVTWIKPKIQGNTQTATPVSQGQKSKPANSPGVHINPSSAQTQKFQNTNPSSVQKAQTIKSNMGDANSEESKATILNSIKEGKTFEEQVNLLQQKLKGNADEVEKNRKIIYNDLTRALSPMFPLHQIHFFGSSITGLDYKGSDLDVYVANVRSRNKPEVMTLKTIRMLIYKSKKFCDLLLISGATVPIIKCIHTYTQICCDLNIRNKLSVANSNLIKYYLSLDEKIRPLMIVVKFWAESYSLKKVNFFSGYALYLLVIFYLQQKPYSVPAIIDLQRNIPPDIEDGWNCAFNSMNYSNSRLKNDSLIDLIAGFFRFYSNFDYVTQVVCPYLGTPMKKICFMQPFELPDSYKSYMNQGKEQSKNIQVNAGICIQDPFEHNRNVSASIPYQHVGKFAVLCAKTAQEMSKSNVDAVLHKILTFPAISLNEFDFTIEAGDDEESRTKIFELTKKLISDAAEKVIGCKLIQLNNKKDGSVTFDCTGQHNLWDNRINILKNLQSQLSPETNDFEREVAASTCIVKYFPRVLTTKLLISLALEKDPSVIRVSVKGKGKCKLLSHIGHFLKMKLNAWIPFFKNEETQSKETVIPVENVDQAVPEPSPNEDVKTSPVENVNQAVREPSPNKATEDVVKTVKEDKESAQEAAPEAVSTDNEIESEPTQTENSNAVSAENDTDEEMIKKDEGISDEKSVCTNNSVDSQIKDVTENADEGEKVPVEDQVSADSTENNVGVSEEKLSERPKSQEEGELVDEEEEEDEEDVPPDFFDDFANQDFMDGLDIVDAWDEETGKPLETGDAEKSEKREKKESRRRSSKYDRSRSRSLTRRYVKKSDSHSRKRSRSRSRERGKLSDVRRDPEKTKRDINKDKIKCARDKEQKLVSDKLRLVETGLVPPGTEMDVDISSIMKEKRRTPSVERSRDMKGERERKYSRRSGSREARKPVRYSRSPVYRPRNRVETTHRSRRRTSSIDSNVSDREMWMRSSRKKTRTRSRSRSRDSPRLKMRKYEEKKKKKSFLEEIRDKLNEVRPTQVMQYSHPSIMPTFPTITPAPLPVQPPHPVQAPIPHPIPAPVPAPSQFFNQNQNNPGMQQYDQSFFIGDAYPPAPSNNMHMNQQHPQNVTYNNLIGNMVPVSQVQMAPVPQVAVAKSTPKFPVMHQNAGVSPKVSVSNEPIAKPTEQKDKQMTDDIDKLFADKKISLSDFLTITAKCEVLSSSPEHLQKKIKVISRCQDAIKAMSDDRKFTGRLSVRPSSESKNKPEVKYQSPLRKIPIVRFQFTTPAKVSEEADTFAAALDKILQRIGVLKETIDLDQPEAGVAKSGSSFADEDTTALTLKASLLSSKTSDAATCEECKKRKSKTFADVGSQCVNNKETASVSTQVTEEDLSPSKGLLKNDSIAFLTPAQLLGKDKEKEKETSSSPVVTANDKIDKKIESSDMAVDAKKEKPKPKPAFKGRGGFRKTLLDRPSYSNNFDNDEFQFYDRGRTSFEEPRNYGPRFGNIPPLLGFSTRQYGDSQPSMARMNQLRPNDGSLFTDFTNQSFRGRNPNRFGGPRY